MCCRLWCVVVVVVHSQCLHQTPPTMMIHVIRNSFFVVKYVEQTIENVKRKTLSYFQTRVLWIDLSNVKYFRYLSTTDEEDYWYVRPASHDVVEWFDFRTERIHKHTHTHTHFWLLTLVRVIRIGFYFILIWVRVVTEYSRRWPLQVGILIQHSIHCHLGLTIA